MLIITTACGNAVPLEDTTITLSIGIDYDENNNLVVYQANPVFDKDAEEKQNVISVSNVLSLRQARNALNATTNGYVVGGKVQVILLGKKLLNSANPINYLDTFYRDPKTAVNVVMVAVDGPVSDVMNYKHKSYPFLSVYLKDLIETAYQNKITVKTELDKFYTQVYNKGITPYITEIKKGEEDIIITGSALLKNNGSYAISLNKEESMLLMLLQGDTDEPSNLTFKQSEDERNNNQSIGIVVQNTKHSVTTNYVDGKFYFDIHLDMNIVFSERTYAGNAEKNIGKLERIATEKLQQGFDQVIAIIQDNAIDPIGLGNYARAYQYHEYKEFQDNWGQALADAEITVTPKVTINSFGVIK
jgi:Ger(x)C family germination protein